MRQAEKPTYVHTCALTSLTNPAASENSVSAMPRASNVIRDLPSLQTSRHTVKTGDEKSELGRTRRPTTERTHQGRLQNGTGRRSLQKRSASASWLNTAGPGLGTTYLV